MITPILITLILQEIAEAVYPIEQMMKPLYILINQ